MVGVFTSSLMIADTGERESPMLTQQLIYLYQWESNFVNGSKRVGIDSKEMIQDCLFAGTCQVEIEWLSIHWSCFIRLCPIIDTKMITSLGMK